MGTTTPFLTGLSHTMFHGDNWCDGGVVGVAISLPKSLNLNQSLHYYSMQYFGEAVTITRWVDYGRKTYFQCYNSIPH